MFGSRFNFNLSLTPERYWRGPRSQEVWGKGGGGGGGGGGDGGGRGTGRGGEREEEGLGPGNYP